MTCAPRLMQPFATGIFAKAEALRTLKLTPDQARFILDSISGDIQKASNMHPRRVSVRACGTARSRGIARLVHVPWHKQKDRKTFHFEHKVTVFDLRERCRSAASVDDVCRVLANDIEVVWILVKENEKLNELDFKEDRPHNAYELAEIHLCADACCA